MRQDGSEVACGRQDHKRSYERIESRRGPEVEAAEKGGNAAATKNRVERVPPSHADMAYELAKGRCTITTKSPECSARGDIAALTGQR